ncbi:uncharacterized protein LOC128958232 [Oppia nitens]|uniref:uncharacterized protein LOC128958232 n=1 Tax=Oppia nitens TaxID=1686743 RepID=UPI0023DCDD96|nr:uncharacterized protein LOC128958232 [Oppia nitens]
MSSLINLFCLLCLTLLVPTNANQLVKNSSFICGQPIDSILSDISNEKIKLWIFSGDRYYLIDNFVVNEQQSTYNIVTKNGSISSLNNNLSAPIELAFDYTDGYHLININKTLSAKEWILTKDWHLIKESNFISDDDRLEGLGYGFNISEPVYLKYFYGTIIVYFNEVNYYSLVKRTVNSSTHTDEITFSYDINNIEYNTSFVTHFNDKPIGHGIRTHQYLYLIAGQYVFALKFVKDMDKVDYWMPMSQFMNLDQLITCESRTTISTITVTNSTTSDKISTTIESTGFSIVLIILLIVVIIVVIIISIIILIIIIIHLRANDREKPAAKSTVGNTLGFENSAASDDNTSTMRESL